MIRATLVYLFIGLYVVLMAPIAVVCTLVTRDTANLYKMARLAIRIAGWMCGVKVTVRGKERIRPGYNYVFVSNHQGNFDAPVLMHVIARDCRAIVKQEMMRIPVLSLLMKLVGFVPIERSRPARAHKSLEYGTRLLKQGRPFIAFPEGTRSRDGRLGPFKKGVFVMALKAGTPVAPVTIRGSHKIQPPGTYAIRPGTVEVIFHEPIPTDRMTRQDADCLMERTRCVIASGLEEMERLPRGLATG